MSSDHEFVSERETQFVPRSDDDDVLWEVLEITMERGKKYKVKWVGVDPATGKPWAQSWVAKHDCTDRLVAEWKAKQKQKKLEAVNKRGTRTSTKSRGSVSSKTPAGSSRKTRTPGSSKLASSRLSSDEEPPAPPPRKPLTTKRKWQSETPVIPSGDEEQADEQHEPPRPRKKRKANVEALLPSLSSDEDELPPPKAKANATPRNKASLKSNEVTSDEDDILLPISKGNAAQKRKARPKQNVIRSDNAEPRPLNDKAKTISPRKVISENDGVRSADPSERPPSKSKIKATLKYKSPSAKYPTHSEEEVEAVVAPPVKVGPPRGAKRQEKPKLSAPQPLLSRAKSRKDESAAEDAPAQESRGHSRSKSSSSSPPPVREVPARSAAVPPARPRQISIPNFPYVSPHSPNLSPGAKARLELFDRMMTDPSQPDKSPPPADLFRNVEGDDTNYDYNDTYDPPHPPSSPPAPRSKSKPARLDTSNGNIVPETESSGTSQSQSQSLPKPTTTQPPQVHDQLSPYKDLDLPAIAVISVSTTSSSIEPEDIIPPQKPSEPHLPIARKSVFKPVPQMSPNTFRSKVNPQPHGVDAEAPPSSIESFSSPKRDDKGRRRVVEDDELGNDSSDDDQERKRGRGRRGRRMTDSELRKRGKELFDQAYNKREKLNTAKRLKNVDDIMKAWHPSSPPNGMSLPSTGEVDNAIASAVQEMEDAYVDLNGDGNSTTLDTPGHSAEKLLTEEARERLRIELRREEEESTQEAMFDHPTNGSPNKKSEHKGAVGEMFLNPGPSKNSLFSGKMDDAEHVEHPSAELQQASVIVQASQGQRHEDTDVEALKPVQQASSPARRVPNNLSDSPKRRLGEALSLLNVKSEEIQRLERELANEHGNMQKMKEELAKLRRSPEGSPRPTSDDLASREAERVRWSQDRSKWETDCATWETQRKEWSEERTNLSERVVALSEVAARAEEDTAKWQQLHSQCSDLEAERVAWMKEREKMTDDIAQRVEELTVLTRRCDEYNQAKITWATDQTKWEAERDAWAEEKVGWESERTALREEREALSQSVAMLTASVEVVTAAKVVAEKDRDFFREQYTQASGFVGSVSAENVELEKKAKIAEGQAQEGVAMIKALFENRVKALRDDIRRWKSLAELLQEKDNRTNDEVRLRAAQAPELEERCRRLAGENSSLEMDLRKLGQAQQRVAVQRNKLYHNVLMLKKERASLKSKLSQLVKAAGTSTQETSNPVPEDQTAPLPEDLESMEFNDMDILLDPLPQSGETSFDDTWFPCMWRPQFRDQCQQVFDSKEDLEKHLKEHFRDLAQ